MSLATQLQQVTEHVRGAAPAEVFALLESSNADLAATELVARSVAVGARMPEFNLPNAQGRHVSSATLREQGLLIVSFYRGQWCPYCNLELKALQEQLPAFEAAGAQLVAISPQTPDNSLSTQQKHELGFEVLSDAGNAFAKKLGIVFELPAALRPVYDAFGIDLTATNGDASFELPVPATYLVSAEGVVLERFINTDYRQRLEPATVLAWLEKHSMATA
jgi:peroxiredoxin